MHKSKKLIGAVLAGLVGLGMTLATSPALAAGTASWSLQKRDLNGDGVVDAYYDTQLNITWLYNPSLWMPGPAYRNWQDAKGLVAGFQVNGVAGWRLPRLNPNVCDPIWVSAQDCAKGPYAKTNELLHLWFVTLDGLRADHPMRTHFAFADGVWYENEGPASFPNSAYYMYFAMLAHPGFEAYKPGNSGVRFLPWPVRDGDVGTPLP
ncbi:hypothetical protein [Parachitinimonas caeni]|uniref:DUF1566 domain-containing protein n=1 Tax=Parachitinimonas caeni TaxID=3031301 RepID=A0ABT7E1C3_9NEIS|nr:hypothetical protein [Parachitinimonas caeni]MDK2126108.1 hypothetical protein [Parachitinimonas caeni]